MIKDTPLPNEQIDGDGDMQGGLGKLSPVTRAVRKRKAKPDLPSSAEGKAAALARSLSTDLHARDKKGKPIPTLAERIAKEGYRAQLRGKFPGKPSKRPVARERVKRK